MPEPCDWLTGVTAKSVVRRALAEIVWRLDLNDTTGIVPGLLVMTVASLFDGCVMGGMLLSVSVLSVYISGSTFNRKQVPEEILMSVEIMGVCVCTRVR
jgi:hypothetical protein